MARHRGLLFVSLITLFVSIIFPVFGEYKSMENIKSELQEESSSGASAATQRNRNIGYYHKGRRTYYELNGPKMLDNVRSKVPIELEFLVGNIEDEDRLKRFDDYGHMRFGKRGGDEQFDDYGHMRFGRSV